MAQSRPVLRKSYKRLAAGFLALALLPASLATATLTSAPGIGFEVLRNGSPIGEHTIRFQQEDNQLIVDIEIGLEVKLAFITLFDYEHRNREVWKDGRLVSIRTETNNNGEKHVVRGRAIGGGFLVNGNEEQLMLPADVIPTSYWNPATRGADRLLNTQTGELIDVTVTPKETTPVAMPWGERQGQLHRISGDLEIDLWYDPNGCLLKLSFKAPGDGSTIDYRPDTHMAGQSQLLAAGPQQVPCKG